MFHALKAGFWVRATLRRLNRDGLVAVIAHKGDEDAGSIFIQLNGRDGQVAILREDGTGWQRQSFGTDEATPALFQAQDYLERQKRYDPDLWLIDIDAEDITARWEDDLGSRRFTPPE